MATEYYDYDQDGPVFFKVRDLKVARSPDSTMYRVWKAEGKFLCQSADLEYIAARLNQELGEQTIKAKDLTNTYYNS